MKIFLPVLLWVFFLCPLPNLLAQTIFLVDAAKNNNVTSTGITEVTTASWANACGYLQTAIDAAAENGGQVWLKVGNYTLFEAKSFIMRENVQVYGNFAGTETMLQQRDTAIRDIETKDNWSVVYGNKIDPAMISEGLSEASLLDGLYFTDGKSDKGGGTQNIYSSMTIRNCVVLGNNANDGGGIYNLGGAPKIINCRFIINNAARGGAVFNDNTNAEMIDCTF